MIRPVTHVLNSADETCARTTESDHPEHKLNEGDVGEHRDRVERTDGQAVAAKQLPDAAARGSAEPEALLDPETRAPSLPHVLAEAQVLQGQTFIVVRGARFLFLTCLVVTMASASIALAPHVELPWSFVPSGYLALATLSHIRCRYAASGGVVPPGTLGDSRFTLAIVAAAGLIVTPTETPILATVPLILLIVAAALAGAADGAWLAMATRHLRLSPARALVTFLQAIRSGEACSWRIVAEGPGREGP